MNNTVADPVNTVEITRKLRAWIARLRPDLSELALDVDIMEDRIIDSLQFMSFITYIEELREEGIAADDIDISHFRSLQTILDRFF